MWANPALLGIRRFSFKNVGMFCSVVVVVQILRVLRGFSFVKQRRRRRDQHGEH